jgi:hypothetical protein
MSPNRPGHLADRCAPATQAPAFPVEVLALDDGQTSYLSADQARRLELDALTPLLAQPATPVGTPKSGPPATPVGTPKSAPAPSTPVGTPKSAPPATPVGTPKSAPPATPVGTPKSAR